MLLTISTLVVICVGIQLARLANRWRVGRATQASVFRGVASVPYAYFHHVHDVVSRRPRAARMHAFLAGGAVDEAAEQYEAILALDPGFVLARLAPGERRFDRFDLDVTVRGAISIAHRLQDPLAELVKVDPKSIGVGQYQHDVSQPQLKKSLEGVVESCVNMVGVDLNTASRELLSFVAGIGPSLAQNIVEHRKTKGLFTERDELLKVSKFSTKVFEQAAGFLRIPNGKSLLDSTGIHPERYSAVRDMAQELNVGLGDLIGQGAKKLLANRTKWCI